LLSTKHPTCEARSLEACSVHAHGPQVSSRRGTHLVYMQTGSEDS
jgi:hypothetical protein